MSHLAVCLGGDLGRKDVPCVFTSFRVSRDVVRALSRLSLALAQRATPCACVCTAHDSHVRSCSHFTLCCLVFCAELRAVCCVRAVCCLYLCLLD